MLVQWIIVLFALLFFLCSLFLYHGKGKWLIAGYNTASKAEREKYDVKKLCRAASFICAVCGVMLCVMAYMGYRVDTGRMDEDAMLPFGLIWAAVVLSCTFAAIKYMNTNAKK